VGPLDFFATLFGDAVDEQRNLVLWESSSKRSEWFADIANASVGAGGVGGPHHVYFGCSLQKPTTKKKSRGDADHAVCVGGIWIDIDMAGAHHQKPGLPTNDGEVRAGLAAMPLSPSFVLHTGGGYHAWWSFKEPYVIESESERLSLVAPSVYGWQELFRDVTGLTIDSTHDLARVLRIPGTINHKYGSEVTRCAWPHETHSYNLSDFDQWRVDPNIVRTITPINVSVQPAAEPPSDKLQLMLEMNSRFASTWMRRRGDLKSQSEHDYSLASMLIEVGSWSDQEITDLLVAHRRLARPDDPKIERVGYFQRTIGKLRAGKHQEDTRTAAITEAILETKPQPAPAKEATEPSTPRKQSVSDLLGFTIKRVVKYPSDPPVYRLETPDAEITLGGVETILSFQRFRAKVADVTGAILAKSLSKRWEDTAKALLASVEVRDLGEASEAGNGVASYLRDYLGQMPKIGEDRSEAAQSCSPWVEGGHVWFFSARLSLWMSVRATKMTMVQLAMGLRNCGAAPRTVAIKKRDGRTSTVRVWGIPLDRVDVGIEKKETA
jgi:hypothetical protein